MNTDQLQYFMEQSVATLRQLHYDSSMGTSEDDLCV